MIGRCRDIRVVDSLSVNCGVGVVRYGGVDGGGHLVSGLLLLLNVMRGGRWIQVICICLTR